MSESSIYTVEDGNGQRIDQWLLERIEKVSRSRLQKWMKEGAVLVNDKAVKKNHTLKIGDTVVLTALPPEPMSHVEPEDLNLNVIYEDDDLLVLNKPKNLVVHPGSGIHQGTLVSGLLHHCNQLSEVNGSLRPGIVHRLDRDTSGLMVAAKNNHAHHMLADQLKDRTLTRIYHAVVWGHPFPAEGAIEKAIQRDPRNRMKMKISGEGRWARTHYKAEAFFPGATLIKCKLDTGRTHQIRIHLQSEGHALFGDPTYSTVAETIRRCEPLDREICLQAMKLVSSQALMATKIAFNHPTTGKHMEFEIPFEGELKALVEYFKANSYEQEISS